VALTTWYSAASRLHLTSSDTCNQIHLPSALASKVPSRPTGSQTDLSFLFCAHTTSPLRYTSRPPLPLTLAVILNNGRPVCECASRSGTMINPCSTHQSSTTSLNDVSCCGRRADGVIEATPLPTDGADGTAGLMGRTGPAVGAGSSVAAPRPRRVCRSVLGGFASSTMRTTAKFLRS